MAPRRIALGLALSLGFALATTACEQDTCSKGLTMPSPTLSEFTVLDATSADATLSWAPASEIAASLPTHYFERMHPRCVPLEDTQNSAMWDAARDQCPMGTAELTGERELTFHARADKLEPLRGQSFRVWLEFPDRRDFVDCKHPRMGDSYVIDMRIELDAEGKLGSVDIRETHRLTAL